MKKTALATLLGLLLAGSLGLFSGNSNEAKLGSSLPLIQNSKTLDFRTGMVAPGKDGVPNKETIMAKAASLAIPFVKNVGQFDKKVTYAADLISGRFFLTDKDLVYSLIKRPGKKNARHDNHELNAESEKSMPGKGFAFQEFFVDKKCNKIDFKSTGEQQAATKVSYFKGNDPSQWHSGVASYQSISLGQVYPGIEVKLKASGKNVEKIFHVSPRTDVADIKIGVTGIAGLEIASDGRLLLKNKLGELAMRVPIAWQKINGQRREVKVNYRLLGKKQYGFEVSGGYDRNHTLIIDPELDTLLASTFLGGSNAEGAHALTLDGDGNIYIVGYTTSPDFPTTAGVLDREINPKWFDGYEYYYFYPTDVFISKLDSNLTTLLAATYLGNNRSGDYSEDGLSIVLDGMNNIYLTGDTASPDFPTTLEAFERRFNKDGGENQKSDAFISKLNNNLTELLASTFLGGTNSDYGVDLVLDNANNVIVTGYTYSYDFPTSISVINRFGFINPMASTNGGAYISKLNSDLTTLIASTFLGGSGFDKSESLATDNSGNVFLTGITRSPDFPTTTRAYDREINPIAYNDFNHQFFYPSDVFVSKFDSNLTTLLASTYLGGSTDDAGYSLSLDSSENIYLTGSTGSTDFPTTPGAFDQTYNGGNIRFESPDFGDAFILKLDNKLTKLQASTFLGGSGYDAGVSLALDRLHNVYLTGFTSSVDFPTNGGDVGRGYGNAFVTLLDTNLSRLVASTLLGGNNGGRGASLVLDGDGDVYFCGSTWSSHFPTTFGSYQQTINGGSDAFVSKLNGSLFSFNIISPNGGENWTEGSSHSITWITTESITSINIDYSIDGGINWIRVAANTADTGTSPLTSALSGAQINDFNALESRGNILPKTAGTINTHSYAWTIPSTPSIYCLVKISDAANAATSDISGAAFSILMNLELQAERREVKSFSITKQYGQIQFMGGNPDVPVSEYRIMRRKGSEAFTILRTVLPSELQNNQFWIQDKYLEKNIQYSYLVEAYNAAGQLVGRSAEKTI